MEYLAVDISGFIAVLTINRPHALNALNTQTLKELQHFLQFTALEAQVKVLILTGTGSKAFIAGADIKEMQAMSKQQIIDFSLLGQNVANILETAPYVTIAAINGYALGAGLEMALACDFIYASDESTLGFPEVSLGLIPGFGGAQRLVSAIGKRLAKEMIMCNSKVSGKQAKEIGLVNAAWPTDSLMKHAMAQAHVIAQSSSPAILGVKNVINCGCELSFSNALELERNVFGSCFDTKERRAAMKKFIEKQD